VNEFTINLNISEIIVVFGLFFVFIFVIFSIGSILEWLKTEFAKNKLNLYTTIVILLSLFVTYRDNLVSLLTNPPDYVFLIGIIVYALRSVYNNYKDTTEGQKMLTAEQVSGVKTEVNSVKTELKTEVNNLKTEVNGVKTEFAKLEKQINTLLTLMVIVMLIVIILGIILYLK
jgi:hypothetical protein